MTLTTIIQGACARTNVPVPTSVIGNTDQNVVQMLHLLNGEGDWFQRSHNWQVLRKEASFTTLAVNTQIADITSFTDTLSASVTDFDRFVPDSMFDRTAARRILPTTHTQYQFDKARTASGIYPKYIMRGNALLFTPPPAAGSSVFFEYIGKNWCRASGGAGQVAFALDTDVGILNERLLMQALVWRFLQAKGLDYAEEFRRTELIFSALTGQEMPMPDLQNAPPETGMSAPYIPEMGFGV